MDKSKTFGRKYICKRCDNEKSNAYYWANRERILDAQAERRGTGRLEERETCSECGDPLEGKQRLTCGKSRCRDARLKRLNPAAYEKRERAKVARRREARRRARDEDGGS